MINDHKRNFANDSHDRMPAGLAGRLFSYLHILIQASKNGQSSISSQEFSDYAGINPTQIRRDLASIGKFGKRGVGYDVDSLNRAIHEIIGATGPRAIALVGAGNLGVTLMGCGLFAEQGLNIAAVFDSDPEKIGKLLKDLPVQPVSEEKAVVRDLNIVAGVLAVPADSAQTAADSLYAAGVKNILNYSGGLVKAPLAATVNNINPVAGLLQNLYLGEYPKSTPEGALL